CRAPSNATSAAAASVTDLTGSPPPGRPLRIVAESAGERRPAPRALLPPRSSECYNLSFVASIPCVEPDEPAFHDRRAGAPDPAAPLAAGDVRLRAGARDPDGDQRSDRAQRGRRLSGALRARAQGGAQGEAQGRERPLAHLLFHD